jgi:hypothetical protein
MANLSCKKKNTIKNLKKLSRSKKISFVFLNYQIGEMGKGKHKCNSTFWSEFAQVD